MRENIAWYDRERREAPLASSLCYRSSPRSKSILDATDDDGPDWLTKGEVCC